jgi:hypothetical protein
VLPSANVPRFGFRPGGLNPSMQHFNDESRC